MTYYKLSEGLNVQSTNMLKLGLIPFSLAAMPVFVVASTL